MKSRKQAENIWSPRSQKSMLRQLELEAEQEKCRNQIAFAEKRIAQEKETAERQTATVVDGNNFNIRQALNKTLADIEERERELAAFRKRETSLQAGINALGAFARTGGATGESARRIGGAGDGAIHQRRGDRCGAAKISQGPTRAGGADCPNGRACRAAGIRGHNRF